ncbi:MAG: YaeQ family protein [Deltaproteobacteria bacterium]|nr:YaeQ family protein [Deltaproteobacteria bacterium]
MALPAIMRKFEIALADSDRGVYEQLEWRVAQHPSESERYLVARVLARALEHGDGLEFSKGGVSDDDEPALVQRDLRGDLLAWIEIGSPTPDRLHKVTKQCKRVVIYAWKQPDELAAAIVERKTHRGEDIELNAFPPELLDAAAAKLDRTNKWDLAVTGGTLYLTIGGGLIEGAVRRVPIR